MPKSLKPFFKILVLVFLAGQTSAQECSCPPESTCKPCSGGYTSLTLRYNGKTAALVLIVDGTNTLANITVSPLQEFKITGSKKNEKFVDRNVPVLVNGLSNTILGSSCSDVQVGLSYGSFTVVAAESMGGSIVCCTTPPPDVISPHISNLPPPLTVEATNGCGSAVTWTAPITTDDCTVASFTSSHVPGAVFPIGTTLVVYSASDESGNVSTSSFTVTVVDLTPPQFTGGPQGDIVLSANAACSATATWTEPQVLDNCSVNVIRSHEPNSVFPTGKTKVQYTAQDASGNVSYFSFQVIVNDIQPPIFNFFPSDQTLILDATSCSARAYWNAPQVSDGCSPVTVTSSQESGTEFPIGKTKVKYVARDESGNEAERELTITVIDTRTVQINNCPEDLHLVGEEDVLTSVSWIQPVAVYACEPVTLEANHEPGDRFAVGKTAVEYVASTPSGKSAHCKFTVTIVPAEKPLRVSKLVTPDGDGLNDQWVIVNIEHYHDNQVTIFDRWGGVVYHASRYDNESIVWKGTNKSGASVPTGTYFYTIDAHKGAQKIQETGSIELVQ